MAWSSPSGQGAPLDASVLGWESQVTMCWRCWLVGSSCLHHAVQSCGTGMAAGLCMVVNHLAELASVRKDTFTKQVCNVDGGSRDQAAAGGWYYVPVRGLLRATRLHVPALSWGEQSAQLIGMRGLCRVPVGCPVPALSSLASQTTCRRGSTRAWQGVCCPSSSKGWGGTLLLVWAQASWFFPNPGQKYLQGTPATLQHH